MISYKTFLTTIPYFRMNDESHPTILITEDPNIEQLLRDTVQFQFNNMAIVPKEIVDNAIFDDMELLNVIHSQIKDFHYDMDWLSCHGSSINIGE